MASRVLSLALLPLAMALSLLIVEYARAHFSFAHGVSESRRLYPAGSTATDYHLPANPGVEFRRHVSSSAPPLLVAMVTGLIGILPATSGLLSSAANTFAVVIVGFAVMNVLPAIPFVGGDLFRAIFWYLHDDYSTGARAAFLYSQLTASGSLGFGLFFLIWRPDTALPGVWCLFLGWMVFRASRSELLRAHLIARAGTVKASDGVAGLNPTIRAAAGLTEAIDILLEQKQNGPALVRDRNVYVGMLNLDIARSIPRAHWTEMTAMDAIVHFDELLDSPTAASLLTVLQVQSQKPGSTVVVRDENGRICGLIDESMNPPMLLRRGIARNVRTASEEQSSREGTGTS